MCLYNEEQKMRFLIERYPLESSRIKYLADFKLFSEFEKDLNKDVCNFTNNEFIDMFSGGLNAQTFTSLLTKRSTLGEYLNWAFDEGFRKDRVDIKDIITREDLKPFVRKLALEGRYITEENLKELCQNHMENAQDAILFVLPFVGVLGEELSEIINLKVKDCNFKTNEIKIVGRDNNPYKMPEWIMNIIKEACEQTRYVKENGMSESEWRIPKLDILPTKYVLRNSGKRKTFNEETKYGYHSALNRFKKTSRLLGYEYLSPKSILKSGIFNELQKRENERELTIQDFKDVRVMFGLNSLNYFDTKNEYMDLFGEKSCE